MKKIKEKSLVKYNFDSVPKNWSNKLPFKKADVFIYLGEIIQMPGHGIFVNYKTGKIHMGFHIDEFLEIPEKDL